MERNCFGVEWPPVVADIRVPMPAAGRMQKTRMEG